MKENSLLVGGIWPFLLVPLILAVLIAVSTTRTIETNIASNAQQAISAHSWAHVENFNLGRSVLIVGTAPTAAAAALVSNLAAKAEGVSSARFIGQIESLRPANFTLTFDNGKVLLSGVLDHPATVEQLKIMVAATHGLENVVSTLTSAAEVGRLAASQKLIAASIGIPDGVSFSVKGQQLSLFGTVNDQIAAQQISANFQQVFSGNIENSLTVDDGCLESLNQLLDTVNITFETGIATINQSSFALLQEIANIAAECPNRDFEVVGHTDNLGKLDVNMALSEARAKAVVEYITGIGLNKQRFIFRGYGPTKPIADNRTEQGRAANRRIEFRLSN